jgi:sulfhydrogenase subunit beta (sulfur reductase)
MTEINQGHDRGIPEARAGKPQDGSGAVPMLCRSRIARLSSMTRVIDVAALDVLIAALAARGYTVVGPTVRDGAIVYDELDSAAELPTGWTDVQDGGFYRLQRRDDEARFGYAVGPTSWKRFLFPPRVRLWKAKQDGVGLEVEEEHVEAGPLAFIGVRACELAAIEIQDRVFLGGRYADRDYAARREGAFLVAVNCHEPGGTCFCVSMDTGPTARAGYDLVLTELLEGGHRFLVEAGSDRGEEILAELGGSDATDVDRTAAAAQADDAAARMGRQLDTRDIRDLLRDNLEHPRWDEVADRCLTCGNCTMACPTCFCSAVEDANDLDGSVARSRVWDSCFSVDYSYIHGGAVRQTARARYRQWLTHKLGTWHDQFGSSGCVGCGRCITWCPVGIDITEEVAAIRATGEEDQ